jgi:hypothetical protein
MAVRPAVVNAIAENRMVFHDNIEDFDSVLCSQGHTLTDMDPETANVMLALVNSAQVEQYREHANGATGRKYVDTDEDSPAYSSHSSVRDAYSTDDSEGSRRRH